MACRAPGRTSAGPLFPRGVHPTGADRRHRVPEQGSHRRDPVRGLGRSDWGQTLTHHPHVHCIVPGGGLSPDGTRWVAGRPNFFLAVKPLARLFRRLFLERLQHAFDAGALRFFSDQAGLAEPARFDALMTDLRATAWVVYAKKPFGGPAQTLAYLGRYTHRVAIANSRLVAVEHDHVAFTWKDYRQDGAVKIMRLAPDEFIRRFLLHTLPDGFHRIRYFGFLANTCRTTSLALCRSALGRAMERPETSMADIADIAISSASIAPACPECGSIMRFVATPLRAAGRSRPDPAPFRCDTS